MQKLVHALCSLSLLNAQTPLTDTGVAARVESLVGQMTLDEKIGQIAQIGPGPIGPNSPQPEELSAEARAWVVEPEQFDVWAGGDSKATLRSEFRITE